jgi:putative salt-induced outer membrane protein YdiY
VRVRAAVGARVVQETTMRATLKLLTAATLALVAVSFASPVAAQAPVPIAQHTEAVPGPPPAKDQLTLQAAVGATLNSGNTEMYSGTAGGRLGLIRQPHQLSIEVLGTLGYAKNADSGDVERTSGNALGRARYDLFLSRMDALFIAIQPRRDTFAGLDLRLQNQIGYLRNLYFPIDAHRLWSELGYDVTYDRFAKIAPAPGEPKVRPDPDTDVVHSARLFLGYTNLLNPVATLNLGVESLFDVEDGKNVRVTGQAELNSSLTERFKLGVNYRVLFDNVPVEGVKKKYDTITAIQLIYTYDSLANEPVPPPCPACDCTADVNAALESCPPPPAAQAEPLAPTQPTVDAVPPVAPAAEATTPAPVPPPPPAPTP